MGEVGALIILWSKDKQVPTERKYSVVVEEAQNVS